MSTIRFTTEIGEDQMIRPPVGVHLSPGKVEVIIKSAPPDSPGDEPASRSLGNVLDEIEAASGLIDGPVDWASEHDHYLYGTPKRSDASGE